MKPHSLFLVMILFLALGCRAGLENQETPAGTAQARVEVSPTQTVIEPTATSPPSKSLSPTVTLSPTPNAENDRPPPPTDGPSPTFTNTPWPSLTPSPFYTPTSSPTPSGTPPTLTPSLTPSGAPTSSGTPTLSISPTPGAGLGYNVQFVSQVSCRGFEYLTFYVENTGSLLIEYAKVVIVETATSTEIHNSATNWPFQSEPDGCLNDMGAISAGWSAYLPIPIAFSPGPPPNPGEHQGTFTMCSENYYIQERGVCVEKTLTFTIP